MVGVVGLGGRLPSYPDRTLPYPDRILQETGFGFGAGFGVGLAWELLRHPHKGICSGSLAGMKNSLQAARIEAPRLGGGCAMFWSTLTIAEIYVAHVRDKEDPLNRIIAYSVSCGLLDIRRGLRVASRSAIKWGCSYALLIGAVSVLTKELVQASKKQI